MSYNLPQAGPLFKKIVKNGLNHFFFFGWDVARCKDLVTEVSCGRDNDDKELR